MEDKEVKKLAKEMTEDLDSGGILIVVVLTILCLIGGAYAYKDSRDTIKAREAAIELKMEESSKINRWAASVLDSSETKTYEVKNYSELKPSELSLSDVDILSTAPRFKFVGVTKGANAPMVYESTISYTNSKGELNSVTQNVYVVYTDEINKPELRVKEVKKDGSKYAKDVVVNPTLYLPNK